MKKANCVFLFSFFFYFYFDRHSYLSPVHCWECILLINSFFYHHCVVCCVCRLEQRMNIDPDKEIQYLNDEREKTELNQKEQSWPNTLARKKDAYDGTASEWRIINSPMIFFCFGFFSWKIKIAIRLLIIRHSLSF